MRIVSDEGMFAERGIDIEIVPQPANLQAFQGLEATGAQVGQITVATLGQAWQAGQTGAFFCGTLPVIQTSLMAPADSDLPSVSEGASWEEVLRSLEGRTIGIQTPVGSALQLIFASALEEAGVRDVTYVNLGPTGSAAQAALANGAVDVAQANPTGTQLLTSEGRPRRSRTSRQVRTPTGSTTGAGGPRRRTGSRRSPKWPRPSATPSRPGSNSSRTPTRRGERRGPAGRDGRRWRRRRPGPRVGLRDYSAELPRDTIQATLDTYVDLGNFAATPKPDVDELVATGG